MISTSKLAFRRRRRRQRKGLRCISRGRLGRCGRDGFDSSAGGARTRTGAGGCLIWKGPVVVGGRDIGSPLYMNARGVSETVRLIVWVTFLDWTD